MMRWKNLLFIRAELEKFNVLKLLGDEPVRGCCLQAGVRTLVYTSCDWSTRLRSELWLAESRDWQMLATFPSVEQCWGRSCSGLSSQQSSAILIQCTVILTNTLLQSNIYTLLQTLLNKNKIRVISDQWIFSSWVDWSWWPAEPG